MNNLQSDPISYVECFTDLTMAVNSTIPSLPSSCFCRFLPSQDIISVNETLGGLEWDGFCIVTQERWFFSLFLSDFFSLFLLSSDIVE